MRGLVAADGYLAFARREGSSQAITELESHYGMHIDLSARQLLTGPRRPLPGVAQLDPEGPDVRHRPVREPNTVDRLPAQTHGPIVVQTRQSTRREIQCLHDDGDRLTADMFGDKAKAWLEDSEREARSSLLAIAATYADVPWEDVID